jgi:hypothetical protein
MKHRGVRKNPRVLMALVCALALWSIGSNSVQAGEVLYDGSGFLRGTQTFTDSFSVSTPGTLTVTLANIAFPELLANLNLIMTSPSGLLGPEVGAGTSTFDVTAGNVTAQWFGSAQGPLNTGMYSMHIEFQAGSPVPLPTSIALLLSGLGLLVWQRRTRSDAPGHDFAGGPRDLKAI